MATLIKTMPKKPKVKKKLKDMNVDEFLMNDFDSSESESKSREVISSKKIRKKKTEKVKKKTSTQESRGVKISANEGDNSIKKNKDKLSLASTIKDSDPDFYQFLKDEDMGLLNNLEGLSDEESVDSDAQNQNESSLDYQAKLSNNFEKELLNMSSESDSDSETVDDGKKIHKLPEKLTVASDDSSSDDEENGETSSKSKRQKTGTVVTNNMIDSWSESLKSNPSHPVLRQVISVFHAAVKEAGGSESDDQPEPTNMTKYRVEGSSVFNSVIRLCLVHVAPSLQTMLQLTNLTDVKPSALDKTGRWKKLKINVKTYVCDLLDLVTQLSEEVMINVILKHIHKLVVFYANFPKMAKQLMKRMIKLWTTAEETTRVLAFLIINKLLHLKQDLLLEACVKQMYMAYVSNCKFTSPTTLPLINFMQRSMVEIFNIDQTVAYQYAFVYIRQLAIHLRNALSVKKKNTCQAVYNWQYIHCLGLWVQLLTTTFPSEVLQPLIYPLTQTIIGTIKLLPTARFYPLRFHCVKFLNSLSNRTNTFIPTLSFLLEVFDQTDFNKRHNSVSLKPFNFAVILKFSKSQLHEKAFKDGLIDQLYEHLLESYNVHAHSVGFPELIVPSVIQLKAFLKKCKVANYCKQIKQIVDKIMEQSQFIVDKRRHSSLNLLEAQTISQWERQLEDSQSPLRKFYLTWRKLRDRELLHGIANKESISGAAIDIPSIKRKQLKKASSEDREDFSKLFEDASDSDDETRFMLKEERPNKKRKHDESDDSDMYSDFNDEELEQLAQSASSGEEESGDEDGIEMSVEEDSEADRTVQKVSGAGKGKKVKTKTVKREKVVTDDLEDDVVEDFLLSNFDSE